jgi:transposase
VDTILGIDIAKAKFVVVLLTPDGKRRHKTCPNTAAGFEELARWLQHHGSSRVHACLEATGTYGDALAVWLHEAGHTVSVVNPSIIHAYARTQLARSKTDALDAALIAQFTATQRPAAWAPPAPEIRRCRRWCVAWMRSMACGHKKRIGWRRASGSPRCRRPSKRCSPTSTSRLRACSN